MKRVFYPFVVFSLAIFFLLTFSSFISAAESIHATRVEEFVSPKEVVVTSPALTGNNSAQVISKPNKKKSNLEEVPSFISKWLNSWKSGDMETYRSCYDETSFQSKGMNLDAWISYKANVHKKSKSINISIDNLQISQDEYIATAVFTQEYSSSILKDKGNKTLKLRKINDEWKIYREIM